jgi:cell division protein FtsZ
LKTKKEIDMDNMEFINNNEDQVNNHVNPDNNYLPESETGDLIFEPQEMPNIIKVIGVGGGGSNAVNYMFKQGIKGVDFVVCNTDAQALQASPVPLKVKLGNRKLGAGSRPDVGKQSAIESVEELKHALEGDTEMLFITAGMGGGTGTGAAPVIAEIAKKLGILTVGIVTIPFEWEGAKRIRLAENGIEELRNHVDTLIVISNSKLRELYGNLSLREAFSKADDILKTAAKGIAELITVPGYVNVDFEDVKTVMTQNESGKAIMSSAIAEGDERAIEAVQEALNSPLLDDNDIKGASDILLHIITGTKELTMDEIEEITEYIQSKASVDGVNANLIWGNGTDESLGESLSVTIIATGFNNKKRTQSLNGDKKKIVIELDDDPVDKTKTPDPVESDKNEYPDEPVLIKNEPEKDTTVKEEPVLEIKNEPAVQTTEEPAQPVNPKPKEKEKVIHDLFSNDNTETEVKKEKPIPSVEDALKEIEKKKTVVSSEPAKEKPVEETKIAIERKKKLKNLSNYSLSDFEKTPAYMRRNVQLDDSIPSQQDNISKYTLGSDEGGNPVINKGNSFLNKDVD